MKSISVYVIISLLFSITTFSQNVIVSGALAGNGSYPTLTDAFTAINGGACVTSKIENNVTLNLKASTINGNNDPVVKNNTGSILELLDSSGTSSINQN